MDLLDFIIIGVVLVLIILLLCLGYVKAPPDMAYIISGIKKTPRVLIGRAGIRIPFFERLDKLLVRQVSIDIKTNGFIPTKDFIGVNIDAVSKIRVLTERDITQKPDGSFPDGDERHITRTMVDAAMKNFLNMKEIDIIKALTDSLQGNMREIIGTQTLKELCNDRKAFGDEVQQKAQKDMNALGIFIESCNIQRMDDENGLINALGQDNMSQIQKDASIAKANADRDVAIARAEADKAANDVQVAADTEIAIKQNELKIKQAELKKVADIKQAEADAAYEIQKEEQRKTIEITKANANIAKQEKEAEIKEKEIAIRERTLDADIKKQADADKYATEQGADADLYQRQQDAQAARIEKEQHAAGIKAQADAEAASMRMKGEAEADAIKARGLAEADAIKAKGLAEAEAMEKKAEAYAKYNKAAVAEMMIKVLPDIAGKIAEPLTQIEKITIIGSDSDGVGSVAGNVPAVMAKLFESMKETTGIDLADIVNANSYEAMVNRNVTVTGVDGVVLKKDDTDVED